MLGISTRKVDGGKYVEVVIHYGEMKTALGLLDKDECKKLAQIFTEAATALDPEGGQDEPVR